MERKYLKFGIHVIPRKKKLTTTTTIGCKWGGEGGWDFNGVKAMLMKNVYNERVAADWWR